MFIFSLKKQNSHDCCEYEYIHYSKDFLQKITTVTQLVEKSLTIYIPEVSVLHEQKPTTSPCPEPHSLRNLQFRIFTMYFKIILLSIGVVQVTLFSRKLCTHF